MGILLLYMMKEAMSVYYLMEQLVRDRHETLVREAEMSRLAAQVRGVRRSQRGATIRQAAGRALIAVGSRLSGVGAAAEGRSR